MWIQKGFKSGMLKLPYSKSCRAASFRSEQTGVLPASPAVGTNRDFEQCRHPTTQVSTGIDRD